MMRYILSLFFLFSSAGQELLAQNVQKEANVWYFGNYLGLDFNSGTAVPLNDGQLATIEGVATISDGNGSLLFYTDGIKVWNKIHQVMPNGTGLFGNPSSTQSAVIVPKIGDPTRYYVFTVDQLSGPKGLNYSVVNMTLDGGKGDVELKNVPLQLNVVEKITAVRHCNNKDVWVIAHGSASDIYYAYLVSATGINTTAVISHTGVVLPGVVPPSTLDSSSLGYLKASPDGKKIAAAHWTVNVDLSDFDNATGIVSNSISLFQPSDPRYLSYGIEFSPNSSLLYTTEWRDVNTAFSKNELHQYDITLGSAAAIRASRQIIAAAFNPAEIYAALQIAPDGKMYMAQNLPSTISPTYISSIGSPNTYGTGCNFTNSAVQWSQPNQNSTFGLPTFIQSYFYPVDSFTYTINCINLTGTFNYNPASNVVSVKWDFGDPSSGANNTSTQNNPTHVFSSAGNYTVKLIKFTPCSSDTLQRQMSTDGLNANLGPDTLVCGSTSLLLNGSAAGSTNTFLWQDGSTNPTFTATADGLYWVQASNSSGCSKRDSINVTFKPYPTYSLGADAAPCAGDTLILNATVTNASSYLWNNGAVTPTIKAYQVGIYWCDVKKDGCTFRDSLAITAISPKPTVNLGADISTCASPPIVLNATYPNSTYLWQDGSTNPTLNANSSGLYWAQVTSNAGCVARDSINIAFNSSPVFNLGTDRAICQGDTLTLNATVASAISYLWSTGATTPTIKVFAAGTYWCEVNNGCTYRDSIIITAVNAKPVVNFGADISTCAAPPILLNATNPNSTYLWQDGSTNPTLNASSSGLYWAQVINNNGCVARDSINIAFNSPPVFNLGTDRAICQGDTLTLNATVASAISYLWSTGATTPTIKVFTAGTYWCEVNNGCSFRDTIVITAVNPKPVVNLGADISTCAAPPILLDATNPNSTYLWQDGSTNPTLNANISGLYWAQVTNSSGCIKKDSINIAFNSAPVFNLGADRPICQGDIVTLNATVAGAISYIWNTGATTPTINVSTAGTYWCQVNNGCTFRDSLIITSVMPIPVASFSILKDTLCEGRPVSFSSTLTGINAWHWNLGNGNSTSTPPFTRTYNTANTYNISLTVTGSNGCVSAPAIDVLTINPIPKVNAGANKIIQTGSSVLLDASVTPAGSYTYLWMPATRLSSTSILQPVASPVNTTTYLLSVEDVASHCKSSDDVQVIVVDKLFVPNAFTPNGDGLNDKWEMPGLALYPNAVVTVFNRYGQKVIERSSYGSNPWDGTFLGTQQPAGAYVYLIVLNDTNKQVIQGQVLIIH